MNFCIFGRIHLFRMISLLFALRQRACTMYVSEPEISVCSSAYTGLVGTAARSLKWIFKCGANTEFEEAFDIDSSHFSAEDWDASVKRGCYLKEGRRVFLRLLMASFPRP